MSENSEVTWLTLPEVSERLGVKITQVHRLLEERTLLADRIDGVLRIPEVFLDGDEPRHDLRGTIVVLGDAGFTDAESLHWLLEEEESLGVAPIAALAAGRKAEVRRVAQALGF